MLADMTILLSGMHFLNISRSNQSDTDSSRSNHSDTDSGLHVRILPLCKLACATRFMHAV